jgi:DmsE family decaheme c-type cytochrome
MKNSQPYLILRAFAASAVLIGGLFGLPAIAAETDVAAASSVVPATGSVVTYSSWAASGGAAATSIDTSNNSAIYVGEKVCKNCHDTENKLFGHTLHANIFRQNPRNDVEKTVCEACHGPGSNHVKNASDKNAIIGYSKEWGTPIAKQTGRCLTCHAGGQRMYWEGSIHQTNKLSCSDCHNPMARFSANGLLKKSSITETCQSCHQQQRAEFRKKSHMPVPEGKMTCEDCHNPHGSSTKRLLKADSVNELCYTCHAEKRGPFIWEHAPVRENCLNCHAAHGSNNDKLLVQTRPFLCSGCHSTTGTMGHTVWGDNTLGSLVTDPTATGINSSGNQANSAWSVTNTTGSQATVLKRMTGRSCQNCHMMIHGSNSPGGARFQR